MNDSHPTMLAKLYRCSVCGGEDGVRSRPCTFVERFVLPVLLLKPVRCAECFYRDYRLIFTPARERHSNDSSKNRNAAA